MSKKSMFNIFAVIIAALCLLSSQSVFAKPVDGEFAKDVGESFIESEITANDYTSDDYVRKTRSREFLDFFSPESQISEVTPIYKDKAREDVFAYVLELEPGGYVVISPDTDIEPVIAYSYTGKFPFEEENNNVLLHLVKGDMEKRLEAIPLITQKKRSENEDKWYEITNGSVKRDAKAATVWGPWITTEWHQNDPYNKYLPMDLSLNKRSVVGCVATGTAQVVNYWKYPKSVSFSSSDSYTTGTRRIAIDSDSSKNSFLSFSQLNSKLSNIQYSGSSDEMAALSFAAGISLKMDYTGDWGSAFLSNVPNALKNKFGYKTASYYQSIGQYYVGTYVSSTTLLNNLKSDVQQRPALLGITANGGEGHVIITDGYKSTGEYHLNFGWGLANPDTLSNAWYYIPDNMPKGYNIVDEAVVDITAPTVTKTLTSVSITSGVSSITGGSYSDYKATAYFSDGTSTDVTSSATWSENSSYAYFDSSVKGRLKTNSVTSNQSVTITVTYTYNSISKSAAKTVTVVKDDRMVWETSKANAVSKAQSQGKKILLLAGRNSCGNTTYMRDTVAESTSPSIKSFIQSNFIPWFCDVDSSTEYYAYASGLGSFTLPLICCIDPKDSSNYLDRTTGTQNAADFYARLQKIVSSCKTPTSVSISGSSSISGNSYSDYTATVSLL